MDRMVVWLREAMDTAERIARAACEGGEGRWHHLGNQHGGSVAGDHEGYHVAFDEGYPTLEQATHIALHDPAAVLRRIAADRQLLELHNQAHECVSYDWVSKAINTCMWIDVGETCTTLRLLAEGYGWAEAKPEMPALP